MGGGIGKAIIENIKKEIPDVEITAVGTNSIATSAMLKAGADYGATGENAVVFNSAKADFIIGVTGIVFANAMHGEISPKMAEAVSSSPAHKILLPVDKCNVTVLGVPDIPIQSHIKEIANVIRKKIDVQSSIDNHS
jgi:acyl-coenzyme A synthetase/AMP-(fatty) acid ligase